MITDISEDMESEKLEAEVEETLGSYPDEYITELQGIKNNAAVGSMRQTFYILAGILGGGLVISFFLSKEKLTTKSDTSWEFNRILQILSVCKTKAFVALPPRQILSTQP